MTFPLLLQLFAASADGQRYLPARQAVVHTVTKSAVSGLAYVGLRRVGVSKPVSVLLSTVGVWAAGKAIERAKGHTLGPWDAVNDLAAHSLLVIPLVSRTAWPAMSVGLVWVGTCKQSSPRWC